MKKRSLMFFVAILVALLTGLIVAKFLNRSASYKTKADSIEGMAEEKTSEWTCSMHPQIRQPKFGKCPICAMDLVPVSSSDLNSSSAVEHKMSASAVKLAEIEVAPALRRLASVEVMMPGKVEFDESRLARISARFPGRIDKLFVNYTGIAVKKGDHVAEIFSPELLVAQREVLLSLKRDASESSSVLKAVREKFRRWGFPDSQVDDIIKKGEVLDHLTIYAPISGIVVERNAFEGKYFETGENLFSIADLSQVWINLDAFETDLPWIKYGQQVEFSVEAFPGRKFSGRVAFIDPLLDESTRTVRIRLNASNQDGALKPGFFVRAVLNAKFAGGGKIIEPSLAGKWISPMHPEIIKDAPGFCDVCGIELVSAESLGFADSVPKDSSLPLLIPDSAPLITGKRAIVYVDKGSAVYEGREIVLGPKAGSFYVVESGLEEGEKVVVKGNFKIDSAMQILAKPSMMSKFKDIAETEQKDQQVVSEQSNSPPEEILDAYFAVQKALAADDLNTAKEKARVVDKFYLTSLADSADINIERQRFSELSSRLYRHISQGKVKASRKIYRFFCPMAFENKGGYWLQDDANIANPYFGSTMLRCGKEVEF